VLPFHPLGWRLTRCVIVSSVGLAFDCCVVVSSAVLVSDLVCHHLAHLIVVSAALLSFGLARCRLGRCCGHQIEK